MSMATSLLLYDTHSTRTYTMQISRMVERAVMSIATVVSDIVMVTESSILLENIMKGCMTKTKGHIYESLELVCAELDCRSMSSRIAAASSSVKSIRRDFSCCCSQSLCS